MENKLNGENWKQRSAKGHSLSQQSKPNFIPQTTTTLDRGLRRHSRLSKTAVENAVYGYGPVSSCRGLRCNSPAPSHSLIFRRLALATVSANPIDKQMRLPAEADLTERSSRSGILAPSAICHTRKPSRWWQQSATS